MKKINWKKILANTGLFIAGVILNILIFIALSFVGITIQSSSETAGEVLSTLISFLVFVPTVLLTLFGGPVHGLIASIFSIGFSIYSSYNLMSAIAVLVCSVLRKKEKFRDYITGSAIISVGVNAVGFSEIYFDFNISELLIYILAFFIGILVVVSIYYLIDRKFSDKLIEVFPKNKDVVIHKNYRKRSIKKELIIIVNTIAIMCSVVMSVFCFSVYLTSESVRRGENISYIKNDIMKELSVEEVETESVLSDNAELIEKILMDYRVSEYLDYMYIQKIISVNAFSVDYSSDYIDIVSVTPIKDGYGLVMGYDINSVSESELEEKIYGSGVFSLGFDEIIYSEQKILDNEISSYQYLSLGVYHNEAIFDDYKAFAAKTIYLFLTLLIYINIFANWRINKRLAEPISDMTEAVAKFAFTDEDARTELKRKFDKLSITTGDEIEVLYMAYGKTMADMATYIDDIDAKSKQIAKFQHNIIVTMADIIESRDENTGGHIKRTAAYVEIIARKLQSDGMFPEILTDTYINDMIVAAPLHDMGKIHVSDTILNKNGRLTEEEFAIMKSHTTAGKEMLENATETLGVFSYLSVAIDMANYHHEWWNGKGYPEGRDGENIPLCARIMAVADVFDALISKRCYKAAMSLEKAYSIIREETGTHFDPVVAEAFFASREEIEKTLNEFKV